MDAEDFVYTTGEWWLHYSNGMTFGKKMSAYFSIDSIEHYNDDDKRDNYAIVSHSTKINSKMSDLEFMGNARLMANASLMYELLCSLSKNYKLSDDERADIDFLLNKIRGGEWE